MAGDRNEQDRGKAIEIAVGQIEKQFGKGSIMRLGQDAAVAIPSISTGAVSLDYALGVGGVPRGRVTEVPRYAIPRAIGPSTRGEWLWFGPPPRGPRLQTRGRLRPQQGASGWSPATGPVMTSGYNQRRIRLRII